MDFKGRYQLFIKMTVKTQTWTLILGKGKNIYESLFLNFITRVSEELNFTLFPYSLTSASYARKVCTDNKMTPLCFPSR